MRFKERAMNTESERWLPPEEETDEGVRWQLATEDQ
jgi:hypothetical protein